jgi:hypothetical protein
MERTDTNFAAIKLEKKNTNKNLRGERGGDR